MTVLVLLDAFGQLRDLELLLGLLVLAHEASLRCLAPELLASLVAKYGPLFQLALAQFEVVTAQLAVLFQQELGIVE